MVSIWNVITGEKKVTDAILIRIIQFAHRLELNGESLGKKTPISQE